MTAKACSARYQQTMDHDAAIARLAVVEVDLVARTEMINALAMFMAAGGTVRQLDAAVQIVAKGRADAMDLMIIEGRIR